MSSWAGMWRQYTLSNSPHAPGNACFRTHKCQCLPSERVCLGVLMVGGVHWPGMAASPGSVSSWRPMILCLFQSVATTLIVQHIPCTLPRPCGPRGSFPEFLFLKLKGTTILSPLTKRPSWRLSSPLMMKKSLAASWMSLYWGQPWIVNPMAALRFTSFKVSALILASPASDTCRDDWTSLTWAWISSWVLLSVVDTGLRDRVSATNMSFPGTYLALTLKRMRHINILWQRSGVSDKSLVFIRGTSVTTENVLSPTG